ncbi:MAG: hypothetical protein R2706_04050 [Acidimicrobiales bacterium]
MAKALSPAKVKGSHPRRHRHRRVIVPDFQLSLAIGKEGQNARLAHRLTGWHRHQERDPVGRRGGWRQDYGTEEWAEGEWIVNEETGEQVWQPADGSGAISAEEWASSPVIEVDEAAEAATSAVGDAPAADAEVDVVADAEATAVADPEATADESGVEETGSPSPTDAAPDGPIRSCIGIKNPAAVTARAAGTRADGSADGGPYAPRSRCLVVRRISRPIANFDLTAWPSQSDGAGSARSGAGGARRSTQPTAPRSGAVAARI